MGMKRIVSTLICGVLLVAALLGPGAYAAGDTKYTVGELDMSVSIPSDFDVFTRDTDAGNSNLGKYGLTRESLLSMMEERDMYFFGLNKDNNQELYISMHGKSYLNDYHLSSDEELYTIASIRESQYTDDYGATIIKSELYQHSQAKFIKTFFSRPMEGSTNYTVAYDTVYNEKSYSIILHSFSKPILVSDEAMLQGIVDSIAFDGGAPAARFTPTAAFTYCNAQTKTTFTVPANWTEAPRDEAEEVDYTQVFFKSLEERRVHIVYTCIDAWSELPESARRGHSRSDVDNSFYSKDDIAKEYGIPAGKIQIVTYGDNEFFRITDASDNPGTPYTTTEMKCYNNGYLHWFLFMEEGFPDYKYEMDFEALLSSVEFKSEGAKKQGGLAETDTLPFGLRVGSILLGMLIAVALYALPVILYRYAIKRAPAAKKKAKIITVVYAICAIVVVVVAIFVTGGKAIGASAILPWSAVNYFVLVGGKGPKAESEAEGAPLKRADNSPPADAPADSPAETGPSADAPVSGGSAAGTEEAGQGEYGKEQNQINKKMGD